MSQCWCTNLTDLQADIDLLGGIAAKTQDAKNDVGTAHAKKEGFKQYVTTDTTGILYLEKAAVFSANLDMYKNGLIGYLDSCITNMNTAKATLQTLYAERKTDDENYHREEAERAAAVAAAAKTALGGKGGGRKK
jgi:hypothetical protein